MFRTLFASLALLVVAGLPVLACGAVEDAVASTQGECCPPDRAQSGSMNLGGYSEHGCHQTHDFFCSTNWRIEKDEQGCEIWRYDIRRPLPGESSACFPLPKKDAAAD